MSKSPNPDSNIHNNRILSPRLQQTDSSLDLQLTHSGEAIIPLAGASPPATEDRSWKPKIGFEQRPDQPSLPDEIAEARNADWIIYTGRYPSVFDAARLGYGIGHREDSNYQWCPDETELPTHFLDNDYRNANLDRFVEKVFELEPDVAVIGDVYDPDELEKHIEAANTIWESYPDMELILVPKCEAILSEIPPEFVLGFPNGKSTVQALDVTDYTTWRELPHRLHILGGTPLRTREHIIHLTERDLRGTPPADIAGLDSNRFKRNGQYGDYAKVTGGWFRRYRGDEDVSTRDIIKYSLLNAKHFWTKAGVWPGNDVSDLALRDELLAALESDLTGTHYEEDLQELVRYPNSTKNRASTPTLRTDTTQAEVAEPIPPLSCSEDRIKWEPAGSFTTPTTYSTKSEIEFEPVCKGCGSHISDMWYEQSQSGSNTEEGIIFQVASYKDPPASDETNHFTSAAREAPDELVWELQKSTTHVFCGDSCRCTAERCDYHELADCERGEQNLSETPMVREFVLKP